MGVVHHQKEGAPVGEIWLLLERVHCVRGLLNGAWILYWLRLDQPAFSSWCV